VGPLKNIESSGLPREDQRGRRKVWREEGGLGGQREAWRTEGGLEDRGRSGGQGKVRWTEWKSGGQSEVLEDRVEVWMTEGMYGGHREVWRTGGLKDREKL
jgi:hypothetical protein